MTTITRELIAAYLNGEVKTLTNSEQKELARIALASLDAGSDNHPAHGPLSNDRLHQIRETLSKAAAQRDGGNIGYAMSDAVKAIDELLEVRTAEPDYIRYDCGCCGWETIEDWRDNDVCPKCNHKPMGKTELFTTPPAPVVPKDGRDQFEEWMLNKWGRGRQEYDFAKGEFLHGENYADSYTRHMWKAWTASRAAMLNKDKNNG